MPPPLFPGADGLGFRRWTIAVVGCLFAVWAGVTLSDSPYLVFAGLAGLLYVGTLSVNARALAWLVIALQPAALIVPFFPGRPFWWELCALLAWPSLLAHFLVNRQKMDELKFDRLERRALLALLGYVGVLGFLMVYRGVGFRAFGGGQMGGRFYVQQVILAILPLLIITTKLSQRRTVLAVCTGLFLSTTYLVSDFSFTLSGGMQKILYFFEIPTDAVNFELGFEATGLRRHQSFWFVGSAAISALMLWMPLNDLFGRRAWFGIPLSLGAALLALTSGHRTVLIQMVCTVTFLTFFQRFWSSVRVLTTLVGVTVAVAVLYFFATDLPLSIQRAISFLPGIEVQVLARDNAADTLNDRIEVLKLAVGDMPQYWVVGRGFGMERLDQLPTDAAHSGVWLQYINGNFYNGLLGSILKTGVPGFVCSILFIWWVSRMASQLVRLVWINERNGLGIFSRLCLLLCAQWFSFVLFFYCLHGDVATWAQIFALPAALIMLCRRELAGRAQAVLQEQTQS